MLQFKALIVDDEEDFLETVVKRLKKRGIDATGTSSGEEALRLINAAEYDVIIMDIKMPGGMDGIEALREIKRIRPRTEVILLTGHGSIETSAEGMKLGAFDYLLKPIHLEQLLAKLAEALEKKENHNRNIQGGEIRKQFARDG